MQQALEAGGHHELGVVIFLFHNVSYLLRPVIIFALYGTSYLLQLVLCEGCQTVEEKKIPGLCSGPPWRKPL
jgi:hypothetical protein